MTTQIAISQFKSHCLEIIDKMQISQEIIIITKRDKPIARIESISKVNKPLFGLLRNKAAIIDDIIESTDEKWSVLDE